MRRMPMTDNERREQAMFEALKAELARAFAAPDSSYVVLTASEIIARNRA